MKKWTRRFFKGNDFSNVGCDDGLSSSFMTALRCDENLNYGKYE